MTISLVVVLLDELFEQRVLLLLGGVVGDIGFFFGPNAIAYGSQECLMRVAHGGRPPCTILLHLGEEARYDAVAQGVQSAIVCGTSEHGLWIQQGQHVKGMTHIQAPVETAIIADHLGVNGPVVAVHPKQYLSTVAVGNRPCDVASFLLEARELVCKAKRKRCLVNVLHLDDDDDGRLMAFLCATHTTSKRDALGTHRPGLKTVDSLPSRALCSQ